MEARGGRVGGIVQTPCDETITATHIESGRQIDLMQDLGSCSEGCRLDTTALAEAAGLLAQSVAAAPDLLLVSRFGRAEAEGGGFLTEIGAAAMAGMPTLVGVSAKRVGDWQAFAGELPNPCPFRWRPCSRGGKRSPPQEHDCELEFSGFAQRQSIGTGLASQRLRILHGIKTSHGHETPPATSGQIERLTMKFAKSIALVSLLAFSTAAWAQAPAMPTAPAAPAMPAAPSAPAMTKPAMTKPAMPATPSMNKPRTAKSLDCSKQADSQALHGKPRKEFMSKCKKG